MQDLIAGPYPDFELGGGGGGGSFYGEMDFLGGALGACSPSFENFYYFCKIASGGTVWR